MSAEDWTRKGSHELRTGDSTAAVESLSEAIKLDPQNLRAHQARAEAYRRLGMERQAESDEWVARSLEKKQALKPGYLLAQSQRKAKQSNSSLFSAEGQISGGQFFQHWLIGAALILIAGLAVIIFGTFSPGLGVLAVLFFGAAVVSAWWITIAAGIKRLHDLDKDGALVLLMFVPFVSFFFWIYLIVAKGRL